MTVDVELRVTGVDLDDERTAETIGRLFPDTTWEEDSGLITRSLSSQRKTTSSSR